MTSKQQQAEKLAKQILQKVNKGLERGMDKVRYMLVAKIKQTLSVPAPREKVRPKSGPPYWRATTRAGKGAPPRLLSGALRRSVESARSNYQIEITASARSRPSKRYPRGIPYGKIHEAGRYGDKEGLHPFVVPAIKANMREVKKVLGQEVRIEVEGRVR